MHEGVDMREDINDESMIGWNRSEDVKGIIDDIDFKVDLSNNIPSIKLYVCACNIFLVCERM